LCKSLKRRADTPGTMSWSPPHCPQCSSSPTRFESAIAFGPPSAFGVAWTCPDCKFRILELCSLGPDFPKPGACLNCGEAVELDGRCSDCRVHRPAMIERVRSRCGPADADPNAALVPSLEAIAAIAEQGLLRLAFNAVDLRLEAMPNDPSTLIAKAKLMSEVCRPGRAVVLLRRAIDLGAREPGLMIRLGVALADSGNPKAAMRIYEAELEHETDEHLRAIAMTNIGGCLSSLGRREEGEVWHRRAIATAPENLGPRWNLFANLLLRGRYDAALEVVEQTIELPVVDQSERENLQAYRAEVLIGLRRFKDALAAIDASLVSNPNEVARLGTRARILKELGCDDAARACLAKALSIDPDCPIAQALLRAFDRRRAGEPPN
jgi:tetratricopeptide (TPR) repeat protein